MLPEDLKLLPPLRLPGGLYTHKIEVRVTKKMAEELDVKIARLHELCAQNKLELREKITEERVLQILLYAYLSCDGDLELLTSA